MVRPNFSYQSSQAADSLARMPPSPLRPKGLLGGPRGRVTQRLNHKTPGRSADSGTTNSHVAFSSQSARNTGRLSAA
jgi:hypothetical protein